MSPKLLEMLARQNGDLPKLENIARQQALAALTSLSTQMKEGNPETASFLPEPAILLQMLEATATGERPQSLMRMNDILQVRKELPGLGVNWDTPVT